MFRDPEGAQRLAFAAPKGRRWTRATVSEGQGALVSAHEGAFVLQGARSQLLVLWQRSTPDEDVRVAEVWDETGELRWSKTFVLPQAESPAPTARKYDFAFGPADPEVRFEARPEPRLVWRVQPRVVKARGRSGEVALAVGADRILYSPGPTGMVEERSYRDFLPPHAIESVEATQQLSPAAGPADPVWAIDGDLTTAWSLRPQRTYDDARLTLRLAESKPIRVIRIVPGCAASADAWARNPTLARATLAIGGRLDLVYEADGALPPGVRAIGEYPLPDGGEQVFIFLAAPRTASWVEIGWEAHRPQQRGRGRVAKTCLSEISLH